MIKANKKTILLAWELGGGLGHISRLVMLARHFAEQNCEVVLAVRHLSHVSAIFQDIQCLTLQAPICLYKPQPERESISFADILWEAGYYSSKELFGLVAGWQTIYDLVQPDFLLADFAPTALLAAQLYDFKSAWLGGGFLSPPEITPWPDFRPGQNAPAQLLQEREMAVLETVNTVLQAIGGTPLKQLANLFDTDQTFLCTWPELDCYERPADMYYWGPCITSAYGQETAWPHSRRKGVFCYLKSDQPQAGPVLDALHSLDVPALVYVENLPAEWEQKYGTPNLCFAKVPVKLTTLFPHISLVICPGGEGVIASTLLAGIPLLLVPSQAEQLSNANRVEALGAGINAGLNGKADFVGFTQQLLSNPAYSQASQGIASRYYDFSSEKQIAGIVSCCLKEISFFH